MVRGWILFTCLTLSVAFKLWPDYGDGSVSFPFSEKTLNNQSWVYYSMEHFIAIAVASCLLMQDRTPVWMLWLFVVIMCVDLIHFLLFYRDEGIGLNLFKVIIYGIPLLYLEIKHQCIHLR